MSKDSPQKKKKIEAMRQLCLQRKIENFHNLKLWDQGRAEKLIVHRKIVDQIDEALQIKLSQSSEFTKIVKQFFIDLLNQKSQNRYLTHPIQNPQAKLQLNTIGRNIHPNASKSLVRLYQNTHQMKKMTHVKNILEGSLSKIDDFLLQSEKQLMELRTKIQLLVLEIQDCNLETLHKCDSLITIYNNNRGIRPFQAQQDFFLEQQKFLYEARIQLQSQKRLGTLIIEYLQFIEQREEQKLKLLKELIGEYINSIRTGDEVQGQNLSNLQQILKKNTQSKYIAEYFSLEQMLPRELIIELARIQGKHEDQITIKFLKSFLKKFSYQQFDSRNLVLKVVKVYLRQPAQNKKKNSISNQQQKERSNQEHKQCQSQEQTNQKHQQLVSVQLFITIDGFINIYFYHGSEEIHTEAESHHKVSTLLYHMRIGSSLVFTRVSDIELKINVRKWGLMSFSQSDQYSINMVFNSEDQRQEFLQFIAQLK